MQKKLKSLNINFTLYIVGDTFSGYEDYELSLKEYVEENDLHNYIVFTGFREDANSYLKSSNFFIHTAIDPDPLPTVILESIILDIPVIATNLGGAIEILDKGNGGLLIPKNNVNKSVNLILNFINNEEKINQKKSFAKEHLHKLFFKTKI